jgi:cytochrome P450
MAPKGAFDFSEFASLFPVTVLCGLLGVSAQPIPNMRDALASQVNALAMIDGFKPQLLAGWETMWTFTDRLVTDREASGEHDEDHLLDALIAAKQAGQLDEIELRFMLLVLLFAGFDTSKNMLSMTMMLLLERPEIYARCAEDKDYCGRVITEALRHSGIAVPYRLVTRDFSYDGVEFRQGELLTLGTPFAGRDSAIFADPLAFDPDRENGSRHVSFGRGPHICLGQFIAKNQLQEGLHLIAQRLRNPRLDGPVAWRHFVGAWGPEKLPIAFDAA